MDQMPPVWLSVFISGGILVIGSVSLLTKSIIDEKEERVKRYEELYRTEKGIAEEERVKSNAVIKEIREILKDIDATKLDTLSAIKLRDAIKCADQFPEDLVKLFDDCSDAAEWFSKHKKAWVDIAFKESVKKNSMLIPAGKRKAFKSDIVNYFEWVNVCLRKGGTRTTLLAKYVDTPAIISVESYVFAVEHVVQQEEWNGLSYQQKELIQAATGRLIELIRKKESHSLTSL